MSDLKLDLLTGLKTIFDDDKLPAILREEGVDGASMNMLSVLLEEFGNENTEAMAEYFFSRSPEGAEEDVIVFQSVVTIAEDITAEEKAEMDKAASILNFYIESGNFCGSVDGNTYAFRHSIVLNSDIDKEVLQTIVDSNAAYAIGVASKYTDLLLKVKFGTMAVEEIEAMV